MVIKIRHLSIANMLLKLSFVLLVIDVFAYSRISYFIRLHDFAVLVGIVSLTFLKAPLIVWTKLKPFFVIGAIYLIYVTSINILYNLYGIQNTIFVFLIGKEVEYLILFIIVLLAVIKDYEFVRKILYIFIFINIMYGCYQLSIGSLSYYGIGSIPHRMPSNSGSLYFMCSIILYYFQTVENKRLLIVGMLTCFLLTIATISRTNILGITIFYLLTTTAHFFYKKKIKTKKLLQILLGMIGAIGLVVLIISGVFKVESSILTSILRRFSKLGYNIQTRQVNIMQYSYILESPWALVLGAGKGIIETIMGNNILAAIDNQYVRAAFEIGVVGIILWTFMMYTVIKISVQKPEKMMSFCLIITFVFMGLGYEVFQVTSTAMLFWIFNGLVLGNSFRKEIINIDK
jgi:hypothetical protein